MGNADSKQKLGERVVAARAKLDQDKKLQSEKCMYIQSKSPKTMKVIMDSIAGSFRECSPFLELTLLVAWKYDENKCKQIILDSCKKVLRSPIIKDEYEWFKQYVFPLSIWMFETKQNHYMYEELMFIADSMSTDIKNDMDDIYNHLQSHPKWNQLKHIKTKTIINRQDHKKVSLLQEDGIKIDEKVEKEEDIDELKGFIDSNLAINILTTAAKTINNEFQNHIKRIISQHGDFKAGPIKKVDRCLSKLENDYSNARYPKAARLLDLVRCSVSFNTVNQLIIGYNGLMEYIKNNATMMELARIKNMFSDKEWDGGYRDIKVCIIYHSSINSGVSMICEIQLMLGQFLREKKRIHKLYTITRERLYFDMVVKEEIINDKQVKDIKNLQIVPILKVRNEVKMSYNGDRIIKGSMESELRLLGLEGKKWFGIVDMNTKETIFEEECAYDSSGYGYGRQCHHWIRINNQKYITVQPELNMLKMFKVISDNQLIEFKEDETLRITVGNKDIINFCEFDIKFENVFIVINGNLLEVRSISDINKVKIKIKLKHKLRASNCKQIALSNDGKFCVLCAGDNNKHFYLIDFNVQKQYKLYLESNSYGGTYGPCFINGDSELFSVGTNNGIIEIWDVQKRQSIKILKPSTGHVHSMYSTSNILAVGTQNWTASIIPTMKLYDVRDWKMFYPDEYDFQIWSIHLTSDLQYLTASGINGQMNGDYFLV